MKKRIWGYSISEVDAMLEMLSGQNEALMQHNDYMEDEIRSLTNQLDEAKASIANGMTKAEADAYRELKVAYAALQERVAQYEKIQTAESYLKERQAGKQ